MWRILLVCPTRATMTQMTTLCQENLPICPTTELAEYPPRNHLAEIIEQKGINIVFLDAVANREWAMNVIGDIQSLNPKLPVVTLLAESDSDFLLRCLRQGASEFLMRPFSEQQLTPVLERLARQQRGLRSDVNEAKVYCVMPAKGACGASTLAVSLAYQWKRLGAKKILLADLDPLTGTLSFQLKVKSSYSFMDALQRAGTLDMDIWKGLVYNSGGVDVLLAPEKPVHGIDELQDATGILDFARINYEVVVIDSNGPYGRWNLTLAQQCDELLLVTTNELPALQATQRTLAYLDRNKVERSKTRIIVNRYNKDVGVTKEVIETALHNEVYHLVPSEYETVQNSLVEGKPIAASSAVGRSLTALADRLSGREAPSEVEKPSGFGGLLSLFGKR
jgi:pilus assembly protein CpaE